MIGINDQIESGGVNGNVGIGFAIGSDTEQQVVPQLLAHGSAEHAWLGVEVQTISPAVASTIAGLPAHGVLVVGIVPKSPAAHAGLVAGHRDVTVNGVGAVVGGDAIVSLDGTSVASTGALADAVALHHPGQTVSLGVVRGGHERTIDVTLGNAPAHPPSWPLDRPASSRASSVRRMATRPPSRDAARMSCADRIVWPDAGAGVP